MLWARCSKSHPRYSAWEEGFDFAQPSPTFPECGEAIAAGAGVVGGVDLVNEHIFDMLSVCILSNVLPHAWEVTRILREELFGRNNQMT